MLRDASRTVPPTNAPKWCSTAQPTRNYVGRCSILFAMSHRGKKPSKRRRSSVANLGTEEGRAEVGKTLSAMGGISSEALETLKHTRSDLWWTKMLSGFEEAVVSVANGMRQSMAESQFVRQLAKESTQRGITVLALLEEVRLGITSPGQAAGKIFTSVPDEKQHEVTKRYQRAICEAGRSPQPKGWNFLKELELRYKVPENFAADETLVLGRKMSVQRDIFLKFWVGAGYWLAEAQDIADALENFFLSGETTSSFIPPSAESIRVWKSELRLISYPGRGRLRFGEGKDLVPDSNLKNEFLDELRKIGVSEEQILEKFGAAKYS